MKNLIFHMRGLQSHYRAIVVATVLAILPCDSTAQQTKKPLSLTEIETLSRQGLSSDALTKLVNELGVSFPINEDSKNRLRKAGLSTQTIGLLEQNTVTKSNAPATTPTNAKPGAPQPANVKQPEAKKQSDPELRAVLSAPKPAPPTGLPTNPKNIEPEFSEKSQKVDLTTHQSRADLVTSPRDAKTSGLDAISDGSLKEAFGAGEHVDRKIR